jgi:hypothetical protein
MLQAKASRLRALMWSLDASTAYSVPIKPDSCDPVASDLSGRIQDSNGYSATVIEAAGP